MALLRIENLEYEIIDMYIFSYFLLLLSAVPVIVMAVRDRKISEFILPYVAFFSVFFFDIVGSIWFIDDQTLYTFSFVISLAIIVAMFYIMFIFIAPIRKELYINWAEIDVDRGKAHHFITVSTMGFICIVCAAVYYARFGLPPLFEMQNSADLYALRAEKVTSIGSDFKWVNWGFNIIPSLWFIYVYTLKRIHPTTFYKALFYSNVPIIMLLSYSFLHKTGIVYMLVYSMMIPFFLKKNEINVKRIVYYASLALAGVVIILRFYLWKRDLGAFVDVIPRYLFYRIVVMYSYTHANVMAIFPHHQDYFYGLTFPNPGHIFPYEPINLPQFLGEWVEPGQLQNMSQPCFSEGYANFGWMGLVLISMMMVTQILGIQLIFKSLRKNLIFFSFYVFVTLNMMKYAMASITTVVGPHEILFMWFFAAVWIAFARRKRRMSFFRGGSGVHSQHSRV